KCLVPLDAATQRTSKIVLGERRRDSSSVALKSRIQVEEAPRVQRAIAEEMEQAAVEAVRSALGNHVDLSARIATEFCCGPRGDDTEFFHCAHAHGVDSRSGSRERSRNSGGSAVWHDRVVQVTAV